MKKLVFLDGLAGLQDVALLGLRGLTGAFLVWGVWDNIADPARMAEFAQFMRQFGFPAADILAPVSVWFQFVCGILFIVGLFTRWAGLLMAFNFIVGFLMVHLSDDFRAQFPALILIAVSFYLAAAGGGRFAADRLLR
ncbi:DoxX family protein [Hyphococcus sp.]|uniref:DoxX family protein n=1 Tax=Hyphococcus sp. TaxID=2038636 RepID=UPI003CCC1F24